MTWRMRVRHTTTYQYAAEVHASYNEARISPLDTPNQFTLEHRVEVHPAANLFRYRDYWGSRVHAFDLHQPHTELTVVGSSLVETAERTPNLDDTVAWDAIDAPGLTDRFCEYLTDTTMTESDDAIRQVARELRETPGPAAALSRLGEWLRGARRVRDGHDERVDDRGRGAARRPRRVPGLRAPRHRGAARRRHPGPLRVGLPLPRRARRGGGRDAPGREPRVARGVGRRLAPARPDQRLAPSPSATCSSRAAATTATSRRSRACTTAVRATRSTSRWSSRASRRR